MVFVELYVMTDYGYTSRIYIKPSEVESVGLHPNGTLISLKSGTSHVATSAIDTVLLLLDIAVKKEETLI